MSIFLNKYLNTTKFVLKFTSKSKRNKIFEKENSHNSYKLTHNRPEIPNIKYISQ